MVDFNSLRSRKGSNFQALQNKLEQTGQNGNGYAKDPNIWKPTKNDKDTSENIIRFLPIPFVDMESAQKGEIPETDLTPMAKILTHGMQLAKGWYIEPSLQTFGEECPIREHDRPLWKKQKETKDDALKEILKKRIPKTDYYANILVIKDGTKPENNGKVFKYQFGETIREILEKAQNPKFETDPSFDPFCPWEGANLILNLEYTKKTIGSWTGMVPKFDNVKWASPSALGDDAFIDQIWKQEHSIATYYDRKKFKTYEELQQKFFKLMGYDANGNPTAPGSTISKSAEEMLNTMQSTPAQEAVSKPSPSVGNVAESTSATATLTSTSGGSEMDEFEKMLNG